MMKIKPKKFFAIAFFLFIIALMSENFVLILLLLFYATIIYAIAQMITRLTSNSKVATSLENTQFKVTNNAGVILKCTKCGGKLQLTDNFCGNCGTPFSDDNVTVIMDESINNKVVTSNMYDPMYNLTEEQLLVEFINRELKKIGLLDNKNLMPQKVVKRKKIFSIIFAILTFIYVSMIFFHFPLLTYIIGAITLFVFAKLSSKYNLIKYLSKEVKARPGEKISNIIMATKSNLVENNIRKFCLIGIIGAIILPLLLFIKPVILYEKVDEGYAVRYYIFGLTNFKTVTIPKQHKGKDIVSLRGNTFSNMPFLREVTLPDTITEIRGQAFKNDKSLEKVHLPENLEYLGGGAFYNCKSLKNIKLPETLKYLGGESFYNATRLESVNIPSNISEIRGSTFENCISLKEINIPNNVTRIGGHAFYNNSSLETVYITERSKLLEIGSSAFRGCSKLKTITIPSVTSVNERAFKESPTTVYRFENYIEDSNEDRMKYSYNRSE